MKNLLIYVSPKKAFTPEHETLTKIQIDNSLSLGWQPNDLLLVTNFPYEYQGIKSIIVGDYEVFDGNRSTKIPAILQLFSDGVIQDDVYWFHDHDAFQLRPFEISLSSDASFSTHGWKNTWNAGSFFFTNKSQSIFSDIYDHMNTHATNEQDALTHMWQHNKNRVNERFEYLDIAYNIGIYYIDKNLKKAGIPMTVAHFHPHKKRHLDLFRSHLPDRLKKIFSTHGII